MEPVFLDTVGLLAVWDRSDQWHGPAAEAFAAISRQGAPVYSSGFVFLELANAAARKPYRAAVDMLRRDLESRGRLYTPGSKELDAAWKHYANGPPTGPGVVDLVSFEAMKASGIRRAFTNDRHFSAVGFETLF